MLSRLGHERDGSCFPEYRDECSKDGATNHEEKGPESLMYRHRCEVVDILAANGRTAPLPPLRLVTKRVARHRLRRSGRKGGFHPPPPPPPLIRDSNLPRLGRSGTRPLLVWSPRNEDRRRVLVVGFAGVDPFEGDLFTFSCPRRSFRRNRFDRCEFYLDRDCGAPCPRAFLGAETVSTVTMTSCREFCEEHRLVAGSVSASHTTSSFLEEGSPPPVAVAQ
jgi:hypothetical protein